MKDKFNNLFDQIKDNNYIQGWMAFEDSGKRFIVRERDEETIMMYYDDFMDIHKIVIWDTTKHLEEKTLDSFVEAFEVCKLMNESHK